MSRIADSIKSLRLERREVAAKLTRLDRLIAGFEALNQLQPRRRRRANGAGVKAHTVKKTAKPRGKPRSRTGAPAGNLAAATE